MIAILLYALLSACLVTILRRAPEGYEDEGGFHIIRRAGPQPQPSRSKPTERVYQTTRPSD